MNDLTNRLEALEKAQQDAQRGLRRWRGAAIGALALALMVGHLEPGVAASDNAGGLPALRAEFAAFTSTAAALEARVQALESKLAKVTVSADGNDLYVTGANLHVRSATGSTFLNDGTGNLLLGYNEHRPDASDKSGSHNLVIGAEHNYAGTAGFVGGYRNTISGFGSSVLTGYNNSATGFVSSAVITGHDNSATGLYSLVAGGFLNSASAQYSVVAAGVRNAADGIGAAILGGLDHIAVSVASPGVPAEDQHWMTIVGGTHNRATGWGSTVTGGANLTVSVPVGWAAGGNGTPAYHSP